MKTYFFQAIRITFLTMILFGVVYPLLIIGLSKLIGPENGNGETVKVNGKVIGFELIGQSFTDDKYFNSRPSAVNYNAAATGGTNKAASNPDYLKQVQKRIDVFLEKNPGISKDQVPVDLITASGGGLDPHISRQAALVQLRRISSVRNLPEETLKALVDDYTENPILGLIGTQTVHVLRLNIALDNLKK